MFSVDKTNRSKYYKYLARLNYEAAIAADDKVGMFPGYELAAPPPVMTLCAHSVELSLKAYLLDGGLQEGAVRKFGHNLLVCWQKCMELGSDKSAIDQDVLAIISDLLVSGRLRYGEESRLGKVPVFGPLSQLCERCLDLCGAPTRAEILKK